MMLFPQETSVNSKEPEVVEPPPPAHTRSTKHRAPKPPAPQPPVPLHLPLPLPVAVSATPASISISPNPPPPVRVSSSVAGWERSQSTLPSVGTTVDEVFSSGMMPKPPKPSNPPGSVRREREQREQREQREGDGSSASPTFAQVSVETSDGNELFAKIWLNSSLFLSEMNVFLCMVLVEVNSESTVLNCFGYCEWSND
ncbi:uncharacterized protein C1orf198 homolog [Notothenia coriiceps]|uniref:Uncharacterized protein C1orf198 homolog n=1 Tax=Notothenia coriiceps TaxID=8208 RepID=A0A6I9N5G1_9TELE|nr:PREDICTED: uncharacterized protein C1orf198 homolog [Notothenia coriiceps]